jgi:adenine phosphoribosyltransferase
MKRQSRRIAELLTRTYTDLLRDAIRDVPDFPTKGIVFKDITPILRDPKLFNAAIDVLADRHIGNKLDALVVIDARGFIFGSAMAYKLGCGIVPVRKKGKLPYKTIEEHYKLEYGEAAMEMHADALRKGDRVVLVDDLLATGGTAAAAAKLVTALNAHLIEIDFLIELTFLKGRSRLKNYPVFSAVQF